MFQNYKKIVDHKLLDHFCRRDAALGKILKFVSTMIDPTSFRLIFFSDILLLISFEPVSINKVLGWRMSFIWEMQRYKTFWKPVSTMTDPISIRLILFRCFAIKFIFQPVSMKKNIEWILSRRQKYWKPESTMIDPKSFGLISLRCFGFTKIWGPVSTKKWWNEI